MIEVIKITILLTLIMCAYLMWFIVDSGASGLEICQEKYSYAYCYGLINK